MTEVYIAPAAFGRGVFAAQPIARGTLIHTFRGPYYSADHPIHDTPQEAYLLQIDTDRYLLPEPPGYFINHSCEPNAGLVDAIHLTALRDIAADEEITFDYATSMAEDRWTLACGCGAPTCRGVVRDFVTLPPALRARYRALGVAPPFVPALSEPYPTV